MRKKIFTFIMLIGFSIINIQGNHAWVRVSSDLTEGSDSACEEYWKQLNKLLTIFNVIHIVNKDWIPSDNIVKSL